MRMLHHLFVAALIVPGFATSSPGQAAQTRQGQSPVSAAVTDHATGQRQNKGRTNRTRRASAAPVAQLSDTEATANLNRQSFQAAQAGKTPEFSSASTKPRQTAQRATTGKSRFVKRTKVRRNGRTVTVKKVKKA
jgi:hypothetical protein